MMGADALETVDAKGNWVVPNPGNRLVLNRGNSAVSTERDRPGPSDHQTRPPRLHVIIGESTRVMRMKWSWILFGEAPGGVMRRHFCGQSSRDPQGIPASS